jgi:hypothetical protein
LKSGQVHLIHSDAPSKNNPEAISKTMSDLTAEFSRELAESISDYAKPTFQAHVGGSQ